MIPREEAIRKIVGLCNRIPGATTWNAAEFMYDEITAALAAEQDVSTAKPVIEHVEKVARAICIASGLDPDFDYDPLDLSGTDGKRWRLFIPHATAALAALSHVQAPAPVAAPVQAPVATVVWYDPRTDMLLYERPHKIIDASVDFIEAAPIGTKLYAAPVAAPSRDDVVRECIAVVEKLQRITRYGEWIDSREALAALRAISGDTSNG